MGKQRFGTYSELLGAKRQDDEQLYTAAIKFPAAKIFGMTPSFTFRHRRNHSNVNWLYSYDKNEIQIQLEKYF
nr:surface lipoprotein assembly modifier [Xenorhabdus lircayensis]